MGFLTGPRKLKALKQKVWILKRLKNKNKNNHLEYVQSFCSVCVLYFLVSLNFVVDFEDPLCGFQFLTILLRKMSKQINFSEIYTVKTKFCFKLNI